MSWTKSLTKAERDEYESISQHGGKWGRRAAKSVIKNDRKYERAKHGNKIVKGKSWF